MRFLHYQNVNFTPEYVGHLLNNLKKFMVEMLVLVYSDYPLQNFSSGFNIPRVSEAVCSSNFSFGC